jgi:hypothetical protein
MRANVSHRRILTILPLLMVIVPRSAMGDAKVTHVSSLPDTSIREPMDELDPDEDAGCLSLGALDIAFQTDNYGSPNVGIVLTDPRGRRIGFDPLIKRAWQGLPVAQGYIDCDDVEDRGMCRGVVQVCGPVSGTYKVEVIAQKTTAYSLTISGRSKEVLGAEGLQSSYSEADLNNTAIRARSRDIVLLNYSRNFRTNVTAQLLPTLHTRLLTTTKSTAKQAMEHRDVTAKSAIRRK